MISRYSRSEMVNIFDERLKLNRWLRVEIEASREWSKYLPRKALGEMIQALQKLHRAGGVDPKVVEKIEQKTRHDLIAFTTAVAQKIGPKKARFLHFGLTSSDVVDTGLSIAVQEAGKIILSDLDALMAALKKKALRYKNLSCIGRTHGVFAEPMTFGMKFLSSWSEFSRARARFEMALENARFGKLSGAVGTNSHLSPVQETRILKKLGLKREPIATQVLPRDRFAEVVTVFGILAGSIERLCIEVRHLSRNEVGEVREGFAKGQKGSSAMPHKRNPIGTENLTGCTRMLRSHVIAALENIALWHERDISHSSVERVFLPDGFILMDYVLNRLKRLVDDLDISEPKIKENLEAAGERVFSGHCLLALVAQGEVREDAYYWDQGCALAEEKGDESFTDLVLAHPKIREFLSASEIHNKISLKFQLRHVNSIYSEVFG